MKLAIEYNQVCGDQGKGAHTASGRAWVLPARTGRRLGRTAGRTAAGFARCASHERGLPMRYGNVLAAGRDLSPDNVADG
ncbi:MAG: hypothetical protein AB1646_25700 [Thermodesulfobacteriota bacterium]